MCWLAKYSMNLLDWHECYLCLVKVFDTNTVHNSSKWPGSLCLLEREGINLLIPENWHPSTESVSAFTEDKTAAVEEVGPQCEVATSCCASMSWCSCSSPSVNAMITLAVPGGNKKACYTFNMIHDLAWSRFSNEWVIWFSPKFSWCICSFAFKWEDIFTVRLSGNTKVFVYSEL